MNSHLGEFQAYYNQKRFRYWHQELLTSGLLRRHHDRTLIRKTGCFYGRKLNWYIDTSDGVNEDLKIYEYTGRIKAIIKECRGKPFLFFKAAYSPVWSQKIIDLAAQNNGRVIPFFKWSFNDNFYTYTWPKRQELMAQKASTAKSYDLGMAANLKPYLYPLHDQPVSWYRNHLLPFLNKPPVIKESVQIKSRQNLHDLLSASKFSYFYAAKSPYEQFINDSFHCRAIINPPGVGEYTSRMFDHSCLGQCVILRRTSYDFGNSWKDYLPEVDFNSPEWEKDIIAILDHYKEYEEKSLYYFNNFWSPAALLKYLKESLDRFSPNR